MFKGLKASHNMQMIYFGLSNACVMCVLKIFCFHSNTFKLLTEEFVTSSLLFIEVKEKCINYAVISSAAVVVRVVMYVSFFNIVMHAYCSVSTHSCVL